MPLVQDLYVTLLCWLFRFCIARSIAGNRSRKIFSLSNAKGRERETKVRFAMRSLWPIIPRGTVWFVKSERSACSEWSCTRNSTTTRTAIHYAAAICNAYTRRLDWNRYEEETEPNWSHMNGTIIMRGNDESHTLRRSLNRRRGRERERKKRFFHCFPLHLFLGRDISLYSSR